VPVTVTVEVAAPAVSEAAMTTDCWPPALRVNCDGVAVTPAGMPETVTLTWELKPFRAVMPMVMVVEEPCCVEAFAGTESEKSAAGGGGLPPPPEEPPPHPHSKNRMSDKSGATRIGE